MIRDLLEILKKDREVKITHLIYKANLSNNSIKPYIEELTEKNMIEKCDEDDKKRFKITQKGLKFLDEYNKIVILSESYGL